jgi:PAS domain S-box-containing protein
VGILAPATAPVGLVDRLEELRERALFFNGIEARQVRPDVGHLPPRQQPDRYHSVIFLVPIHCHRPSERAQFVAVPTVSAAQAAIGERAAEARGFAQASQKALHPVLCCYLSWFMSQLQLLLQKVLDGVVVMRRDGTVADWNSCAELIFGWTRDEAVGRSMNDLIVPAEHREGHRLGLERYLATGNGPVIDNRIEISAIDKSGRQFPIELSITEVEYRGELAFIGFLRDISERKAAELALKESEARLAATYNHALVGIGEVNRDGRFIRTNEQFCRISGYTAEELSELSLFDLTHPEDLERDLELFEKQWTSEIDDYTLEKRYIRKDGGTIWIELAASIVRGEDGASSYGVRIIRDISDRRIAEDRQRLLLNELNHRVKNMLAVVQGIAQQTFKGDSVPPDLAQTFQARLAALAAAHDLVIRQNWAPTPMKRIIEEAVLPFAGPEQRFTISGEEVLLPPHRSVTLALAMHELATNAAKYGALSTPEGRVTIAWVVSPDWLELSWQESGGPAVSEPKQRGFGSRLLQQGLARELGGSVDLDFRREGVVCTIGAPLAPAGQAASEEGLTVAASREPRLTGSGHS